LSAAQSGGPVEAGARRRNPHGGPDVGAPWIRGTPWQIGKGLPCSASTHWQEPANCGHLHPSELMLEMPGPKPLQM